MRPRQKKVDPALAEAISRAGSGAALGRLLGVGRRAVAQWNAVPVRHIKKVNELFGIAKRRMLDPHFRAGD